MTFFLKASQALFVGVFTGSGTYCNSQPPPS